MIRTPIGRDAARCGSDIVLRLQAHIGVDQGSGLIRSRVLTPAKVHESEVADALTLGDEKAVYADKAYEKKERRTALRARGVKDRLQHRRHKHQATLPYWQYGSLPMTAAMKPDAQESSGRIAHADEPSREDCRVNACG